MPKAKPTEVIVPSSKAARQYRKRRKAIAAIALVFGDKWLATQTTGLGG
jgi:hypothetical protein